MRSEYNPKQISVEKLIGKKIKEVIGGIEQKDGVYDFCIDSIVFEDNSIMSIHVNTDNYNYSRPVLDSMLQNKNNYQAVHPNRLRKIYMEGLSPEEQLEFLKEEAERDLHHEKELAKVRKVVIQRGKEDALINKKPSEDSKMYIKGYSDGLKIKAKILEKYKGSVIRKRQKCNTPRLQEGNISFKDNY